jgi:hypothetical protein
MYAWSWALASSGASDSSIAARMWSSHRSRASASIANGKCRARSRGWPRSSPYVVGPPQYWTRNSVSRRRAPGSAWSRCSASRVRRPW